MARAQKLNRPLASVGLTYAAALAIFTRVPAKAAAYCALALLTLLGLGFKFFKGKARSAVLCALLALFAAAFGGWAACSRRDAQCELISGRLHDASLVITSINDSYSTPLVEADVTSVSGKRTPDVTTSFFLDEEFEIGDSLSAAYEFDEIYGVSRSGELSTTGDLIAVLERSGSRPIIRLTGRLREYMAGCVAETLGQTEEGLLCAAVITGERDGVPVEVRDAMNRAGDSHLLAVSGLHITLLLGSLLTLLARARLKPLAGVSLAALLAVACIVFYSATPSVIRAAVMALFSFSGPLFSRKNDPVTSMSAAALIILMVSPLSVRDASFLLSFSCCFAIVAVFPAVDKTIRKKLETAPPPISLVAPLLRAFALSGVISVVTMPVVIALEFPLSLVAPLVNVPVIALTPFMLGASFLIPLFNIAGFLEPLRMLCGIIAGLSARAIIAISKLAASLPYAAVSTRAPWLKIWAALCCVAAAAAYLTRNSPRLRINKRLCAAACALTLAVGLLWMSAARSGAARVFTYGDVAAIEGGDGTTLVVKGISANGAVYLKSYLRQRGADDVIAIIVVDYLSKDKLSALIEATDCETVYRCDKQRSETVSLRADDLNIEALSGWDVRVSASGGATVSLSEPVGVYENGFHVSAESASGKSETICDGGAEYHSADITIYFGGKDGYRKVRE